MSPEVQQLLAITIPIAIGGLIVAVIRGATLIVTSQAKTVEIINKAAQAREEASAASATAREAMAVEREKMFNTMFTDLRRDVDQLRDKLDAKETKIRELLEKLSEFHKLERDIDRLRREVSDLTQKLEDVQKSRAVREKELNAELKVAVTRADRAEADLSQVREELVKEKAERLKLEGKVKVHDQRLEAVEIIRQTPTGDLPIVRVDGTPT